MMPFAVMTAGVATVALKKLVLEIPMSKNVMMITKTLVVTTTMILMMMNTMIIMSILVMTLKMITVTLVMMTSTVLTVLVLTKAIIQRIIMATCMHKMMAHGLRLLLQIDEKKQRRVCPSPLARQTCDCKASLPLPAGRPDKIDQKCSQHKVEAKFSKFWGHHRDRSYSSLAG